MACTYDPALPTNRDWVRNLIGDTAVPDGCLLEDEEIDANIAEVTAESGSGSFVKFCAAALAWEALVARATTNPNVNVGKVVEKAVGRLRLRRNSPSLADLAEPMGEHLRQRCAEIRTPRPRVFRSVAKTPRRYRGRF